MNDFSLKYRLVKKIHASPDRPVHIGSYYEYPEFTALFRGGTYRWKRNM